MNLENILLNLEQNLPKLVDPVIQAYFEKTEAQTKQDGSIVTEADFKVQETLQPVLLELLPGSVLLGEEMSSDQQLQALQSESPVWCLDPVDGTNNFHHGVPLYAISLALINQGKVVLGVVYDPVRHELFSTISDFPLRLNGNNLQRMQQPVLIKKSLASVDFKRLKIPFRIKLVENMPFKSQRNIGTCALEWAWVAAGRTQLLLHGGEKLWDYAAGVLLVESAGGKSCNLQDEPIYNASLEPRSIVAASSDELFSQWQAFLKTLQS